MRGDNSFLAVTTVKDEVTGEVKPLFGFPVQVCKAVEDKEPKFEYVAPSGGPVGTTYYDEGTGEPIEYEDRIATATGDLSTAVPEEALEEIAKLTEDPTMVVEGGLAAEDLAGLLARATGSSYFLQSPTKGGSPKAYRLVYEGLAKTGRAFATKLGRRGRERPYVIYADEGAGCMRMVQVAFAAKLRAPDAQVLSPLQAEVTDEQIAKIQMVIEALPDGRAWLDTTEDEVLLKRQAIIDLARVGEPLPAPKPVAETKATDTLEDALEASLAAVG